MSNADVRRAYGILLGFQRPVYTMYPLFTGAGQTAGIVMVPGIGVWGDLIDIVPAAGGPATEFFLMEAVFTTVNVAVEHEVRIVNTTAAPGVSVYQCRVAITGIAANLSPFPMPFPIRCAQASQIQGQVIAAAAADVLGTSLLVATGL